MTEEAVIIETFFKVVNKQGDTVDFKLNEAQRQVDEQFTGRDLVPKARQEGVSMYYLARFTAKCMTSTNMTAAVISHESAATRRLLDRVKFFVENFKGPRPATGSWSQNMITFEETRSRFFIGTAGSRTPFGRGDTINLLHCSEYAYWEGNGEEILKGLIDSVPPDPGPASEIGIESTGQGIGNPYHRRCMDSVEGRSYWNVIFLPWHTFSEYTLKLTLEETDRLMSNLNPEWGEIELRDVLTPGQIAWRRRKLADKRFNIKHFKQEFPMYLHECFQMSKGSLFYNVTFHQTNEWRNRGNDVWVLGDHPKQGMIYSIGVDPAGGTGDDDADNAAIEVICVNTNEQVAEWAGKDLSPDRLGTRVAEIGKMFNYAFVTVESNNHGPVTLDYLRKDYPYALIYDSRGISGGKELDEPELMSLGFRTTAKSKPIMIGRLRTSLAGDIGDKESGLTVHSPQMNAELTTFIEDKNGKLCADTGCLDDRVMALACANLGTDRAALMAASGFDTIDLAKNSAGTYQDPFTLEGILAGVTDKNKRFPIAAQNRASG